MGNEAAGYAHQEERSRPVAAARLLLAAPADTLTCMPGDKTRVLQVLHLHSFARVFAAKPTALAILHCRLYQPHQAPELPLTKANSSFTMPGSPPPRRRQKMDDMKNRPPTPEFESPSPYCDSPEIVDANGEKKKATRWVFPEKAVSEDPFPEGLPHVNFLGAIRPRPFDDYDALELEPVPTMPSWRYKLYCQRVTYQNNSSVKEHSKKVNKKKEGATSSGKKKKRVKRSREENEVRETPAEYRNRYPAQLRSVYPTGLRIADVFAMG